MYELTPEESANLRTYIIHRLEEKDALFIANWVIAGEIIGDFEAQLQKHENMTPSERVEEVKANISLCKLELDTNEGLISDESILNDYACKIDSLYDALDRERIERKIMSLIDPACDHCSKSNAQDCREDMHFFCYEQARVIADELGGKFEKERKV